MEIVYPLEKKVKYAAGEFLALLLSRIYRELNRFYLCSAVGQM